MPSTTPPLACASLARLGLVCQLPLEIVSLEGRPCLLVSTSSRGQAWLPPQSGRPWLSLLSVCCLHPAHYFIFVLFFFQLISWHSQRHRFHNLPGVPRELGIRVQSRYYSVFHQPPPYPTPLAAATTTTARLPPSHPLLTPPASLGTLVTAAEDELTESVLLPLP